MAYPIFSKAAQLLDWPDDVAQLANALKIDKFAVIGVSGGGPYMLACAYKMPERITSATTISGMGPTDDPDAIKGMLPSMRLGLDIAPRVPWGFVRLALDPVAKMVSRNPLGAKKLIPSSAPETDKKAFARPDIQEIDRQDLSEAYRNGAQGAILGSSIARKTLGIPPRRHPYKGFPMAWGEGYNCTPTDGKICGKRPVRL